MIPKRPRRVSFVWRIQAIRFGIVRVISSGRMSGVACFISAAAISSQDQRVSRGTAGNRPGPAASGQDRTRGCDSLALSEGSASGIVGVVSGSDPSLDSQIITAARTGCRATWCPLVSITSHRFPQREWENRPRKDHRNAGELERLDQTSLQSETERGEYL